MPHTRLKRRPSPAISARAAVCWTWLRAEYLVETHLGKALAARPYWRSLLEMYLADMEQRSMFSSCFLTGETPSNVHRRSLRLVRLGALTRKPDETDHRRVDLRLTPSIRRSIEEVLDAMIALDQGQEPGASTVPSQPPQPLDHERPIIGAWKAKITEQGHIALPIDLYRSLGIEHGDTVLVDIKDHDIRIRSGTAALRQIQRRLRQFAPLDGRVTDALIAERRADVLQA